MTLRMSFVLPLAAAAVALTAALAIGSSGAHADVTPRGVPEREWRDSLGHVIKRLDRHGHLTLYTRDEKSGRVVQIVGLSGTFTVKSAEWPIERRTAWSHYFEYDEAGILITEIDCRGENHRFGPDNAPKLDEMRGTALQRHHHGR
jgi:hypothetical protein